jgi:class 3 adenylate cyclase
MVQHLHTFLFADLVGYTALTAVQGDDAAAELAIRFGDAVAELAVEHNADVVKQIGDAVMLRGSDAAEMIDLGLRMHSDLEKEAGFPPIHVGLNTGTAISHRGDWFGSAVNIAARVASAARAGEVLITESTMAAARAVTGTELLHLGPQMLKNLLSPVHLYAVSRRAEVAGRLPEEERPAHTWVPHLVAASAT